MPVRSLNSSVHTWPDRQTVDRAARDWAAEVAASNRGVAAVGYFGSYARDDWGPGSDLDLVVIVESADLPFGRRSVEWETSRLPVPTDILVYTVGEWRGLDQDSRFYRMLRREVVWVYGQNSES